MIRSIRFLFSLLLAFGLFTASTAYAAEHQVPILSVNGSGSVESAPDQAVLSLGVVSHAATAQAAQEMNARTASSVRNALKALGIEDRDIRTENYNFHPDYNHSDNHYDEIIGYTASNTVNIRIRDLSLIGEIIDDALASGANNVNSLDFSIRDTTSLRREALTAAVKDAREKANVIAHALGKQIIGVQTVSENSGAFRPSARQMLMAKTAMDEAASTPIDIGSLTLTADVHIDFILSD